MTQGKPEIIRLRTAIKANPRLEIELKGRISELLRQFDIEISNEILADLVFALEDEISSGPLEGLPRPTLPPV